MHWLEQLQAWSAQFEQQHMRPARTSERMASATPAGDARHSSALPTSPCPQLRKRAAAQEAEDGHGVGLALADPTRGRRIPDQPVAYIRSVNMLLLVRMIVARYICMHAFHA